MREVYTELYPFKDDPTLGPIENAKAQQENDILKLEAMGNETYMAACFLPCHHDYAK